jgi:hypothetical protein
MTTGWQKSKKMENQTSAGHSAGVKVGHQHHRHQLNKTQDMVLEEEEEEEEVIK